MNEKSQEIRTHVIRQMDNETMQEFWTRLANEIQIMACKIHSMDVNIQHGSVAAKILFTV